MRLVELEVVAFQAIERAELALGRGLNVIYGPNDLGKSTVASAIRAALLVMPGSTEADRYRSWYGDELPRVRLVLADDDGRYWRVDKTFGGSQGSAKASLESSKDGVSFVAEADGRAVDEKIRKILGWGIPSPGGKGAPRGLPSSFLANVLLAEQAHVEAILEASTEGDGTDEGKARLRKALAGLAEDPFFKRVLVETQKRVDGYFTATGRKKLGKSSPFSQAADAIKERGERLDGLRKSAEESRTIEENVGRLREAIVVAHADLDDATRAHGLLREAAAKAKERAGAEDAVTRARDEIAKLDKRVEDAKAALAAVGRLTEAERRAKGELDEASAALATSDATVRAAEDALRDATSEKGAKKRELERAKSEKVRAELAVAKASKEKHLAAISAAITSARALEQAVARKKKIDRALDEARDEEAGATKKREAAEADLEHARAIRAYGSWRVAANESAGASDAAADADAARARAAEQTARAEALGAHAETLAAEVAEARKKLPDPALTKRIEDLHQKIAMAEAALGGGFSIALKGAGKAALHVTTDGEPAVAGTMLEGRLVLEAERKASVAVGDLVEIEIVAGAAEKRRELERLRERWANEAKPFLKRAGVDHPAQLREALSALAVREGELATARAEAQTARGEAAAEHERAALHDTRKSMLASRIEDERALAESFARYDKTLLASAFEKLGDAWRPQVEALIAAQDKSLHNARERAAAAASARTVASYQQEEATTAIEEARAAFARAVAPLGLEPAAATDEALEHLATAAQVEIDGIALEALALEEGLGKIDREATRRSAEAKAALEGAKAAHAKWATAVDVARAAHDTTKAEIARAEGRAEQLRIEAENADRPGAEERLADALAAFEAFAGLPVPTPEALDAAAAHETDARAALDRARADLSHAEGALTKVGGSGVRDELRREQEAYALAMDRQRELELDAEAWKLLRETLEDVEKEGSTHLGRALAAPVSARLAELTQRRYEAVRLDPHLKSEAAIVGADHKASALDVLSVGTRDQVATLLRLTVAEHLKSAVVLDDHLVHSDEARLAWFREALRDTALKTQIVIVTCRPGDYASEADLPRDAATRDLAGGLTRLIDATKVIRRAGR